jgi:hypothetical protein
MLAKQKRIACLAACAMGAAGFCVPGQAWIIDGVQPGALDQPQINAIIYLGNKAEPQIGETEDPLGDILGDLGGGLFDPVKFFNVQAYLDTGASGILISTPTAASLGLITETSGGTKVLFSDVGVAGTDDFNVSTPVRLSLAHFIPGLDLDKFADAGNTIPITTPYTPIATPISGTTRFQVGPYVPTVDGPSLDEIDELIAQLMGGGALNVIGMPAMKNRVMVIDPAGVKGIGLLFEILGGGGDINDISDEELENIGNAGIKTYLYERATAPVFDPARTNNPGIPETQLHVQLSYGSFNRFTFVHLEGSSTPNASLPGPTLDHNPFIGKNPVALLEGADAGSAPGITITRHTVGGLKASEGNWLLDTGAAASIISEAQALAVGVKYQDGHRPGLPDEATPILVDAITGAVIDDQFTLVIGGIGGQQVIAGFYLEGLKLPTIEGLVDDSQNLYYTNVPVLVGNITVADPLDPTKTITLDGIFGMNMLIESIFLQTDATGGIEDLGDPSPSFFEWITFDEANGILGLTLDPTAGVAVPEPASLLSLACGMGALLLRRKRGI